MKAARNVTLAMGWAGVVVLCIVASVASSACGAALNPGDSQFRPGYEGSATAYESALPSGYSLVDGATLISPVSSSTFVGTVQSDLYTNGSNYLFAYKITNSASSTRTITEATIGDLTNPWLGWTISSTGAQLSGGHSTGTWTDGSPYRLSRDLDDDGAGLRITWYGNYTTRLKAGDYSSLFWFVTNAPSYTTTVVSIHDSGASGTAEGYAPAVPVPSAFLGLLSLAGTGGIFGWRRWVGRRRLGG